MSQRAKGRTVITVDDVRERQQREDARLERRIRQYLAARLRELKRLDEQSFGKNWYDRQLERRGAKREIESIRRWLSEGART
jgi:hypothetical protein